MKTHSLSHKAAAIAVPAVLMLAIASPAFADTTASVSAAAAARLSARSAKTSVTLDAKADKETTVRIDALNALATRVNAMVHVSADQKSALSTSIAGEVSTLTSLDAKIKADTDATTKKADIASVTKSVRVYQLIVPQVRVAAAADRASTIGSMISAIGTKLQTRITAAAAAGKDVTALNASLSDMNAKIADAQAKSQAAASLVSGLVPDNGDATVEASNAAALKSAQADLKTAQQDYVAARKDVQDMLTGIKGTGATASVSATATTTAQYFFRRYEKRPPGEAGRPFGELLGDASETGLLAACGVLLDDAALCSLVDCGERCREHFCCLLLVSCLDRLLDLLDRVFHGLGAAVVDHLLAL